MPQEPSFTDSPTDLWRKIARNLYEIAVAAGYTGTLEPNGLDNVTSSQRKAVVYAAFIGLV